MSWDVIVRVDGREIVVLSDQDMCGKDPLSEDEETAIRQAGEHLLAFIGGARTGTCQLCGQALTDLEIIGNGEHLCDDCSRRC